MRVLVQPSHRSDQLFEGSVEVLVDDGQVKPVAVQLLDPSASLHHRVKLFVLTDDKK